MKPEQKKHEKQELSEDQAFRLLNGVSVFVPHLLFNTALAVIAQLDSDGHLGTPTTEQIDEAIGVAWQEATEIGNKNGVVDILQGLIELLRDRADVRQFLAEAARELGIEPPLKNLQPWYREARRKAMRARD